MDRFKRIAPLYTPERTRFDEIPRYAEGLYELRDGVYAWMVPNGSWGESNAGLVMGDCCSLLIDTLWDLKYTRAMLDAMAPLIRENPITTIINTHADGDHWWGNELIPGVEIITSIAACDEMRHIKPLSMTLMSRVIGRLLCCFGARQVGHWFRQMGAPYDFAEVTPSLPTRTFEKELSIKTCGFDLQLFTVGPAHTLGDVLVHIPESGVLFCGDIVFVGSTPVMWAGPISNMKAALNTILRMDADIIVPGHGPVTDKSGVRQVLDYWEFVEAEANRRYDAGMPAAETARDIVMGKDFSGLPFSRWNSPERMMTNVSTMYRHRAGETSPRGTFDLLKLLAKQARLAYLLPDAEPQVMRYR